MIQITLDQVLHLAPNCHPIYLKAFAENADVLGTFGILESPLRLCHFMAQVCHESQGLTRLEENLNYSSSRLTVVWPSRFLPKGTLSTADYAHNPAALANEVYGGRMGNTDPGDGYRYRGQGMIQITGRSMYQSITDILTPHFPWVDLVKNPAATTSPDLCLAVAAAFWDLKQCNKRADADNIAAVTRRINGGLNGLADRMEWLEKAKHIWG